MAIVYDVRAWLVPIDEIASEGAQEQKPRIVHIDHAVLTTVIGTTMRSCFIARPLDPRVRMTFSMTKGAKREETV
jgi:hypothetical protein